MRFFEYEAKSLLRKQSIGVPAQRLAGTIEEVKEAAARIGFPVVLSLSHHSTRERFAMIDAARKMGVKRISIAHPFNPLTRMSIEQMKTAADKGVYLEHLYADFSSHLWNWDETIEAIGKIGADHFVLGSDSGRWDLPPPIPLYRVLIAKLILRGIPEGDIKKMVRLNAEKLIWGEP